jgi:hypothetical protein
VPNATLHRHTPAAAPGLETSLTAPQFGSVQELGAERSLRRMLLNTCGFGMVKASLGRRWTPRGSVMTATGYITRAVGVDLAFNRGRSLVAHRLLVHVPIRLPGVDPVKDRPTADAQLLGRGTFRPALIQIFLQQHSLLPSVHGRLHLENDWCDVEVPFERLLRETDQPPSVVRECATLVRHKSAIHARQ